MTGPHEMTTSESHPLQGYWEKLGGLGSIEKLLSELASIPGMVLGVDRMTRLGVALAALAGRRARFLTAAEAADVMMPLLTINGEAQLAGRAAMATFWGQQESGSERPKGGNKVSPAPWQARLNQLRLRAWLVVGLIAVLVLGVVFLIVMWPNAGGEITPTPPSVRPVDTSPEASATFWPWLAELFMRDILHRLFAILVVACFAALWWSYARNRRDEQLARDRKDGSIAATMTPEINGILFPTAVVRRAGRLLRRPVRVAGHRIDVRRSVEASIEAVGYPTLETGLESRAPDCLMLVERIGSDDHLSALADALAKRLRDGGADLLRYEFRLFPDVLEAVGRRFGGQPVVSLAALARRHPGARVVIVGTGRGFFEPYERNKLRLGKPFFGEPEELPWVDHRQADRQLRQLPRALPAFRGPPILMTPSPPDRWGPAERALQEAGFAVISLGSTENANEGLESAVEAIVASRRPQAVDRGVMAQATPGYDPLLLELDRAEFASDIPPVDNALRGRLARRVMAYACARIGEAEEGDPPEDPYQPYDFALRAGAGLAALALFPRLDPNFTSTLWKHITGHAPSAARLARLARLPWFRAGRMPDWFRSDLAQCFQRETERHGKQDLWKDLRAGLTQFANLCLSRSPNPFGTQVYRSSTPLERLLSQMRELRQGADTASRSLVEERLFLNFLEHGEVAGADLAVRLPAPDRLTQAMRLSLLGFGVAALVAAAFAPWALRTVYSWAEASLALSRSGDRTPLFYMLAACLPVLALGIVGTFQDIVGVESYPKNKLRRLLYVSMILANILCYFLQNIIVTTIVFDGSFYEIIAYSILYVSVIGVAALLPKLIFISPMSVGSPVKNRAVHYSIGFSAAVCLSFSFLPVSSNSFRDEFLLLIVSLIISGVFFSFPKGIREKSRFATYILLAVWQISVFFLFLNELRGLFGFQREYGEYISVLFLIAVFSPLIGTASFSVAYPKNLKRLLFIFVAAASAVAVSFQYYRTFADTVALPILGLIATAAAIGWFWLFRTRRPGLRLSALFLRLFRSAPVGRFGSAWIGLCLRAALSGSIIGFLVNALVGFLVLYLGSEVGTVALQAIPAMPGLVSKSSPEPLAQIAATASLFLACYVLCRLTMRIYPAANVGAEPIAKKHRRWTEAPWWVAFALWAIAVLPASLHNWLSTVELLNIGALSKLGAQGFATIDSVEGALTWALQALFWLGGSTWAWLSYLALPVALGVGLRKGPAADRPIFIGLLPFLLAVTVLPLQTPGGVWMVPLVFLLLRLAREPALGRRLLRFGGGFGDRPSNAFLVFALVFCLALVLSPTLTARSRTSGVMLVIDPDLARAAVFVVIGAMQLSRWPVLAALGLHLFIAVGPAGFGENLADTGISLAVGLTPGEAINLMLAYAAVPLAKGLRRLHQGSPSLMGTVPWTASVIVLGMVVAMAIILSLDNGGGSVDAFVRIVSRIISRPPAMTVPILSLAIGLVIPPQYGARLQLVVLGSILAAVAYFAPGFALLIQSEALTSPFADAVAATPSLALAAGFMLLGHAAAAMFLSRTATGKLPQRAAANELPAHGYEPAFSMASAVDRAVLSTQREAVLK
ncbi:hypothetical protein [Mesorhizobium sp. M0217]|uniref:hypothetical protein n=1 Tax=unclassified Mesorhizobium TaxID=325217 RepID=UPI00333C7D1A